MSPVVPRSRRFTGWKGRVRAQIGRDEGADRGLALVAPAVDGDARGLVYYEYVLVLPDHVERVARGRERARLRVADLDLDKVAGAEHVHGPGRDAVYAQGVLPVLEPRHEARGEAERAPAKPRGRAFPRPRAGR